MFEGEKKGDGKSGIEYEYVNEKQRVWKEEEEQTLAGSNWLEDNDSGAKNILSDAPGSNWIKAAVL